MKLSLFTLLIALPLVIGCKKEDKVTDSGTPTASNSFTLKKDGVTFSPAGILISYPTSTAVLVKALSQAGQENDNMYLVAFERSVQPGVYQITNGQCPVFLMEYHVTQDVYYSSYNGTFTVNSNDTVNKVIDADFQFTINNPGDPNNPVISDGAMTVHYQ